MWLCYRYSLLRIDLYVHLYVHYTFICQIKQSVLLNYVFNVSLRNTLTWVLRSHDLDFDMYLHNQKIHSHNTRQKHHLHVAMGHSNLYATSFYCTSILIWNDILKHIAISHPPSCIILLCFNLYSTWRFLEANKSTNKVFDQQLYTCIS